MGVSKMRRFVHVFLVGGIGNQLSSLAAGYVAARIQARPSMLHFRQIMRDPLGDSIRSFRLDEALSGASVRLAPEPCSVCCWAIEKVVAHLRSRSQLTLLPQSLQSLPSGTDPISSLTGKNAPWLVGNYESQEVALEAFKLGMRRPLKLLKSRSELSTLLAEAATKRILGVRVRRGDFRTWMNGSWPLPDDWCVSNMLSLRKDFDSIRIASDEPGEAATVFKALDDCTVISGRGLLPTEEMVLLSRCKGIVCSRSSFSWRSAFWVTEGTQIVSPHGDGWRLTSWFAS